MGILLFSFGFVDNNNTNNEEEDRNGGNGYGRGQDDGGVHRGLGGEGEDVSGSDSDGGKTYPYYPDGTVVVQEGGDSEAERRQRQRQRQRELSHIQNHILVELAPGEASRDPYVACSLLAELVGGTVEHVFIGLYTGCEVAPSDIYTMSDGDGGGGEDAGTAALADADGVVSAAHDGLVESFQTQGQAGGDPLVLWNLDRIDQCALPLDGVSYREDASNVKVFVMDGGIRGNHEEFVGVIDPTDTCHFSVETDTPAPLVDVNGHGTHVAGTACGLKFGVAANCQLCSVKVFKGQYSSWARMIEGMNHVHKYCTEHPGTRCVLNMSIGATLNVEFNTLVDRAVATAGIVVVAAAGNTHSDACQVSPASAASAIAVGAMTMADGMSPFSNFGTCVDVWAPGSGILSAGNLNVNVYSTKDGTSMAAPHVTGIAAAILSSNPMLTPYEVKSIILNRATTLPIDSGLKLVTTSCTTCSASVVLPAHCTPSSSSPTSTPTTSTPTSAPPTTAKPTNPITSCQSSGRRLKFASMCPASPRPGGRWRYTTDCCAGRCYHNGRGRAFCK